MIRVGFWTPLPPQASGIADYSYQVLGDLEGRFALTAVVDDRVAGTARVPKGVDLMSASYARSERFDVCVYQVGNHIGFHRYMLGPLLERPGILVLHDPSLLDLVVAWCGGAESSIFEEELRYDLGERFSGPVLSMLDLGDGVSEPDRLQALCCRRLVEASVLTLVNSHWAARELSARYGVPAEVLPMPASPSAHAQPGRGPVGGRDAVFGVFGGLAPHKRVPQALEAFLELRERRRRGRLVIAGRSDYPDVVSALEERLAAAPPDAKQAVEVVLDPPTQRFDSLLAGCDVVIGLRWPTAGEMSAVIPAALSNGCLVVVSDAPQFRELPASWCWRVPTGVEVEQPALVDMMERVLDQPKLLDDVRQAAISYARERLRPELVAETYASHIESVHASVSEHRPEVPELEAVER